MQSPPAQAIEHVAEVQVWWQSPPGHDVLQVAPAAQKYWQSLLEPHALLHVALAEQPHVPPSQANAPDVAAPPSPPVAPLPHATTQ
jgi:hypothetical protein